MTYGTHVLLSGDDIIWVVGRRIDDRFKLTDKTERVFEARMERNHKCIILHNSYRKGLSAPFFSRFLAQDAVYCTLAANTMTHTDLGSAIRQRRLSLSLRPDDLAEIAGVSRRTLLYIEQGKANPSWNTVLRLLDALGLRLHLTPRTHETS